MKTLALLSVLAALAVAIDRHWSEISKALDRSAKALAIAAPSVEKIAGSPSPGVVLPSSLPAAGNAPPYGPAGENDRKFVLRIAFVKLGGDLVADAHYYNLPPSSTTHPESLDPQDQAWTNAGTIYVTGVPNDGRAIPGAEITLWLAENGIKACAMGAEGPAQNFRAYRVVGDPLEGPSKPGVWMARHGRTALDQPTHR